MRRDRHGLHSTVALAQAKDGHLASGAPAAFVVACPVKRGFVALDRPLERPAKLFFPSTTRPWHAIEPLPRDGACAMR